VPPALLDQLAVGGRLVMPVGSTPRFQRLMRVERAAENTYEYERLEEVAFVPLIGEQGWKDTEGHGDRRMRSKQLMPIIAWPALGGLLTVLSYSETH
jgi:hypothetical protein